MEPLESCPVSCRKNVLGCGCCCVFVVAAYWIDSQNFGSRYWFATLAFLGAFSLERRVFFRFRLFGRFATRNARFVVSLGEQRAYLLDDQQQTLTCGAQQANMCYRSTLRPAKTCSTCFCRFSTSDRLFCDHTSFRANRQTSQEYYNTRKEQQQVKHEIDF